MTLDESPNPEDRFQISSRESLHRRDGVALSTTTVQATRTVAPTSKRTFYTCTAISPTMASKHVPSWILALTVGSACQDASDEVCDLGLVDVSEEYGGSPPAPMCEGLADETEYPAVALRFVNDTDVTVVLLPSQGRVGYVDADPTRLRDDGCGRLAGIEHTVTPPMSVMLSPGGHFEQTWLADRWIQRTIPGACANAISETVTCDQRVAMDPDALQGFARAYVGSRCGTESCTPNEEGWCTGLFVPNDCSAVAFRTIPVAPSPSTCGVTDIRVRESSDVPLCLPTPWCNENCPVSTAAASLCGLPCEDPGEQAACSTETESLRCVDGLWHCDPVASDSEGSCPPCQYGSKDGVSFVGGCRDVGCPPTPELGIEIPPPLVPGAYTLELDDDSACTFVVPPDCPDATCTPNWNSTCIVRAGGPQGTSLRVVVNFEAPTHLRLLRDELVVADQDIVPTLDVYAPSGFACSSVCIEATVRVVL